MLRFAIQDDFGISSIAHDGQDFIVMCRSYHDRLSNPNVIFQRVIVSEQRMVPIAFHREIRDTAKLNYLRDGCSCQLLDGAFAVFKMGKVARRTSKKFRGTKPLRSVIASSYRHIAAFTGDTHRMIDDLFELSGRDWPPASVVVLDHNLVMVKSFDFGIRVSQLCFSPDGLTLAVGTYATDSTISQVIIIDMED